VSPGSSAKFGGVKAASGALFLTLKTAVAFPFEKPSGS
jgi:hypothetical protein